MLAVLFAYGTLQDADVLSAVLGRPIDTKALQPATAPQYRAVPYPHHVYPALVPAPDGNAHGLLINQLSDLDLAVLDAFEGDEYRRDTITVLVGNHPVAAQAYLPVITIAPDAPSWSLATWTSDHKATVLGTETNTATALRQRLSAGRPG
ncbi:gamma-glutamylcyclotransferase family protein [Devosia sp. 2618]|uniref:gamma-glutamylcyclotransferase family protein n=1 Tax=Devosia sp. 2618 TaxID=3156454 RepID=UPI003393F6F9